MWRNKKNNVVSMNQSTLTAPYDVANLNKRLEKGKKSFLIYGNALNSF